MKMRNMHPHLKNLLLLCLLSLAGSTHALAQDAEDSDSDLYDKGYAAMDNENYKMAIKYFTKAIAKNPKYGDAYWERGTAYFDLEKYDESISDYSKAISYFDDSSQLAELYADRADAYNSAGKTQLAIDDYTKGLTYDAENGETLWNRGLLRHSLDDYSGAAADYTAAMKFYDEDHANLAFLHSNRAQCYRLMGRYAEAMNDCNDAVNLNPDDGLGYSERAALEQSTAKYDDAVHDYKVAARYYLNDADQLARMYTASAKCYMLMGNYDKALSEYGKAIDADPAAVSAYKGRALLYISQKKDAEAKADLDKILHLEKSSSYYTAFSNIFLGKKDQALADIKAITTRQYDKPTDGTEAYYNAACLYALMNDVGDAVSNLDLSLQKGWKNIDQINHDSDLDNIRKTSEYDQVLKKYNIGGK